MMSKTPFSAFVRKEFYHIFRDRWTTLILLIMPMMMLLLLGFAITTEVKNAQIVVLDPSRDEATRMIINTLEASEYFEIKGYVTSIEEVETLFQKGDIGMVLVFSEHFSDKMLHTGKAQVQLIADGSDPNYALTLTQYATAIIGGAVQESSAAQGSIPCQIHSDVRFMYNPTLKGGYNTVPGVLGMVLMLICAMMTSISIAREKEFGTMEILLVSPVKPIVIILSKTVPYILISLINLTTILLLSVFVLNVPVTGNLLLFFLLALIFIFVSLSLGLLVSSVAKSQMVAMLISGMLMMLPVILLSGIIFPVESMPLFFQWLANIIPANWFIRAVKKVMIQGLGLGAISFELMILSGMALLLVLLSLKAFKKRLD